MPCPMHSMHFGTVHNANPTALRCAGRGCCRRFSGAARFDPSYAPAAAGGMYQVPTYQTEVGRWGMLGAACTHA